MKKFWLVALIIAAMVAPEFARAQVQVASGTLQISGKVKWLYTYMPQADEAVGAGTAGQFYGFDGMGIENFATTNAEIDINGTVGDKVSYVIELQSALLFQTFQSNSNELGIMGIRQANIKFKDVIPMTTVTVGTFELPVSIYQPRATNDYDLIQLPLINQVSFGNPAGLYAPMGLGWQATGVNFAIQPADMVELDVVYYNGNAGGGANDETDLEKSWLVNLKLMPVEGAMISIAYLTEGWQEDLNARGGTEQQNAAGYVVSGSYDNKKLEVNGDWMTMTAKDYQQKGASNKLENLTWTGYQITAGYWVTDAIEPIIRYEFVDPNTTNSRKTMKGVNPWPSEYDALTVLTLGVNYRVTENSEVAVNYAWITEQGDKIDMQHKTGGVLDPRVGGKYQALDNDTLMIQVQLWQ